MTHLLYRRYRLIVAVMVTAACIQSSPVSAAVTFRTVALTGDPAPGTSGVYDAVGFTGGPQIDDSGRVAFAGRLSIGTGGVTNDNFRGIWSEGAGSLSLVARDGSVAPGTSGAVYTALDRPSINGAGQVSFFSALRQGIGDTVFGNHTGAWSEGSGSLSLLVRGLDPAPDTAGSVFGSVSGIMNNASQHLLLSSLVVGIGDATADNNGGIWTDVSGSMSLVIRQGSPAPGTAPGVVYGSLMGVNGFNNTGQTSFSSELTGPGVTDDNNTGIWSDASGSISLIARTGFPAAGTSGGTYLGFDAPRFNNAGQSAFRGFLTQGAGNVTADNDQGLWSDASGSLSLVLRKGDAAPGVAGAVINNFLGPPRFTDAGELAFQGTLRVGVGGVTSSNDRGVWAGDAGSFSLIAREGDVAPGTTGVFRDFNTGPAINGAGQVMFVGNLLTGTGGVTAGNDRGIWATEPDGTLTLIVREGDWFDVDPDPLVEDLRRVLTMDAGTGLTAFNDAGQIAYKLGFTDGLTMSQGIFVASVPEPAALFCFGAVGLSLIRLRNRTEM